MKNFKDKKIDAVKILRDDPEFLGFLQDENVKVRLAAEVYSKRDNMRLSQQELADMVDTTQKVISKIESADVNLGIDLLNRIARSLNLSSDNLGEIFNRPVVVRVIEAENKNSANYYVNKKMADLPIKVESNNF